MVKWIKWIRNQITIGVWSWLRGSLIAFVVGAIGVGTLMTTGIWWLLGNPAFLFTWAIVFLCAVLVVNSILQTINNRGYTLPLQHGSPKGAITLIHDNVEWEDVGISYSFNGKHVRVEGPFCPADRAPLHYESTSAEDRAHVTKVRPLRCPECREIYPLSDKDKYVSDSRDEVRSRFEGMRRQRGGF